MTLRMHSELLQTSACKAIRYSEERIRNRDSIFVGDTKNLAVTALCRNSYFAQCIIMHKKGNHVKK